MPRSNPVRRRFLSTLLLIVVGVLAAIAVIAFFVARDDATLSGAITSLAAACASPCIS